MFTPINFISSSIDSLSPKATSFSDPTGFFGDIFQQAIQDVKDTDAEKNHVEYLSATGQLDNPAELTLAGTKAQTSVELLVQLRAKAMEAYNELMRISI